MSFACFKFSLTCPRHNLSSAVDVDKIINFNSGWKKSKLYQYKCGPSTCTGKISYVCDTREEVLEKMSAKRTHVLPNRFMSSASETEDVQPQPCSSKSTKYDKILAAQLTRTEKNDPPAKRVKPLVTEIKKLDHHLQIKKISEQQNSTPSKGNPSDDLGSPVLPGTNLLEKKVDESSNWLDDFDNNSEVESAQDDKEGNIEEKECQIKELKSEVEALNSENKTLRKCNLNFQKLLFDEFGLISQDDVPNKENSPVQLILKRPIGAINKNNNTIHLGSDIWIDVDKWNGLVINSGNVPSLFARNASRSVFGVDILMRSSITGKSSNRATKKETRDRLDSTKVIAIQSAFEYWATKLLQPPMNVINVQHYKTCIPTYIGKFCDDLRGPQKKKRVGSLTEHQIEIEKEFRESNEVDNTSQENDKASDNTPQENGKTLNDSETQKDNLHEEEVTGDPLSIINIDPEVDL